MSNIMNLRGEYYTNTYTDVIEELEDLLKQAKRGEIIAMAFIGIRPNGNITTCWRNQDSNGHLLVAGCEYAKLEMMSGHERKPYIGPNDD